MRIEVVGDESINRQACTYGEYRLFAAISQALDTAEVGRARLVLRRVADGRGTADIECTVTVELSGGEVIRISTFGDHPYAAINAAVDRLRINGRATKLPRPRQTPVAAE